MPIVLVTGPTVEPITAAELKLQCKIGDDTSEDTLLTIYIAAARALCEGKLNRALIDQTWRQTLDDFPDADEPIRLLRQSIRSVTTFAYTDSAGDAQTMVLNTDFLLDADGGFLRPMTDEFWPSTYDKPNAVTITFVAGYGATAGTVPAPIRQWILLTAATMYANREAVDASGRVGAMPERFWDSLLDPFVVFGV